MGQNLLKNIRFALQYLELYFSVNKVKFLGFFLNSTLSYAPVVLVMDFRNAWRV